MRRAVGPLLLVAAVTLLALVPVVARLLDAPFYLTLVGRIMIFAIAAVSLDLILGYGGMVSFGHAVYLGVGVYAVGILSAHGVASGFVQWPVAVAASAVIAAAIGLVSLRTSGVYFIMITLAFAQMLYFLGVSLNAYGGDDGMPLAPRSRFAGRSISEPGRSSTTWCSFCSSPSLRWRRLVDSRFGMVIRGCRSNERRDAGDRLSRRSATSWPPSSSPARMCGARRRPARQHDRVRHAGLHALDALGRDHGDGHPRRHGHAVRPGIGAIALLLLEDVLSG